MMKIDVPFFWCLLVAAFQCSFQHVNDVAFNNYCNRASGELTLPTLADNKPTGAKCKFTLQLWTKDEENAQEHCDRWAVHHVVSAKKMGDYAQCFVENLYNCRVGYIQIRGMCYKKVYERRLKYPEAEQLCKNNGAEILKLEHMMFGETLEDQFDSLTKYFIQPSSDFEKWVTYSGGSGPNFVIVFGEANFYHTGANGVLRFKEEKTADVICQYKPDETVISAAAKSKKWEPYFYPSSLTADMIVWRSAGMYTRTSLPSYDVCEASMKAIIGSNDGTLMEMKPEETKHLTQDLRDTFVQSFAPFSDCQVRYNSYRVFFQHKKTTPPSTCTGWPSISENEYHANFDKDQERSSNKYSYVFYSKETSGGIEIEGRRHAVHGPMLCGLIHIPQIVAPYTCPAPWVIFQRRRDEYVCHRFVWPDFNFAQAKKNCEDWGGEISRWTSRDEFEFINERSNAPNNCTRHICGPYVGCYKENGCETLESKPNPNPIYYPFMGPETTGDCWEGSYGNSMCERKADPV